MVVVVVVVLVVVVVVGGGGGGGGGGVPSDYCCGNSTNLYCGGERFGYFDGDFSWFSSRKCYGSSD